jgi:hypothetical protein
MQCQKTPHNLFKLKKKGLTEYLLIMTQKRYDINKFWAEFEAGWLVPGRWNG